MVWAFPYKNNLLRPMIGRQRIKICDLAQTLAWSGFIWAFLYKNNLLRPTSNTKNAVRASHSRYLGPHCFYTNNKFRWLNGSIDLSGSQACCAYISVTRSITIHNLYASNVRFPVSLRTSTDLRTSNADMTTVHQALFATFTLCHLIHLLENP